MKVWINYVIKVFAMGLIVLVLFSLSLFWARLLSEASIGNMIPDECRQVTISPSGLVPPEFENEPNIVEHSRVSAGLGPAGIIYCLGIVDYFAARVPHMPAHVTQPFTITTRNTTPGVILTKRPAKSYFFTGWRKCNYMPVLKELRSHLTRRWGDLYLQLWMPEQPGDH